jgi:hypothetical protein
LPEIAQFKEILLANWNKPLTGNLDPNFPLGLGELVYKVLNYSIVWKHTKLSKFLYFFALAPFSNRNLNCPCDGQPKVFWQFPCWIFYFLYNS